MHALFQLSYGPTSERQYSRGAVHDRTAGLGRRVPVGSLLWHHPQVILFDLRICRGTAIDATTAPGVRADVGVVGERIR
jgi:hypothetical protein